MVERGWEGFDDSPDLSYRRIHDTMTDLRLERQQGRPCAVRTAQVASERKGLWVKPLTLVLTMLAIVPVAIAQTANSSAAQVHDHLQKAERYLSAKDSDAAAKEFNAVLALDPRNAEAYADLGVIAFFRRDYRSAVPNFRKALAIRPSLTNTQALLGICETRLGDPSARKLLEQSFPKLTDKPLQLQAGLELAQLYEQQGDPGATAALMKTLVDLDPDNVDVLFMAQRVYSELADDTLNKLAVLAPGSARMQQVIAERLVNEGDLKRAIEHYKQALQIDPRLPGVHFELGEAILQSAPADAAAEAAALNEFEAAVAVDGDTAKTECEFAALALLQSDPAQALTHYQKAFQLDPNEVQAQLGLAKLALQENPQEAVKYLRLAVQSDPLNGSAHYQLAQAYKRLQMMDEAHKEVKLFEDTKRIKDQVQALYHQMNRQMKPETGPLSDENAPDHAQ